MIRNSQSSRSSNNFTFHVPLDLLTQLPHWCSPASLLCCLGLCHINDAPLHMDHHSHLMMLVIPTITSNHDYLVVTNIPKLPPQIEHILVDVILY